ncbi:MAG: beta-lactamase family protein [Gemmatimonadetes bacterium]|nr:beta-lactamase family protein [Gemmatimonadota bacterium]
MLLVSLLLSLGNAANADSIRFPTAGDPPAAVAVAHPLALPSEVGMRVTELLRAEEAVVAEVQRGGFPGAAIAIGRWDRTVVERGVGRLDWNVGAPVVDPDFTIYDLASLTKVIATTTAVMLLVEDGRMQLDAPVSHYLPNFYGPGKEFVTVRHLLLHNSGLPAGADIWAPTPEGSSARALTVPLRAVAGQRVEYSDIGFVVLWAAAEAAYGGPLYRLLDERVFGPLDMRSTTFLPGRWCERCAPTGQTKDGAAFRGVVHDPTARRIGGITGNAGLFSTVHDLTRFAAMLAMGGEVDGVRVLERETIERFTRRQAGAGTRALGWDTPGSGGGGAAGVQISSSAFGHTGFTGTSLWVDPDRGTWVILLSNRTFEPRAPNRIQAVRRTLHDFVAVSAAP